jgi:hypothetical protein
MNDPGRGGEMASVTKEQVDERLRAAHSEWGLADDRSAYRDRLRALRATNEDAFQRASEHYEREVVPRIVIGEGVIDGWIAYGRLLGELTEPGRLVSVDGSGRSRPYEVPYERGTLVLFIPVESGRDALAVAVPAALTPAQQATVALLVEKKLGLVM